MSNDTSDNSNILTFLFVLIVLAVVVGIVSCTKADIKERNERYSASVKADEDRWEKIKSDHNCKLKIVTRKTETWDCDNGVQYVR